MKKPIYSLNVVQVRVEDEVRLSYGISCTQDNSLPLCINDISLCRASVEEQVKLFNELELSPTHFPDAVDDFLCDSD